MEYDSHSHMKVMFLLEDPVFDADVSTASIDMEDVTEGLGYESLEYIVTIGAIATVGGTIEARCQESDDDSVWTDCAANTDSGEDLTLGGEALTVEAGNGLVIPIGAQNAAYRLGSISKKRYQRLSLTEETAVSAGQITVIALLGHSRTGPVPDQSS